MLTFHGIFLGITKLFHQEAICFNQLYAVNYYVLYSHLNHWLLIKWIYWWTFRWFFRQLFTTNELKEKFTELRKNLQKNTSFEASFMDLRTRKSVLQSGVPWYVFMTMFLEFCKVYMPRNIFYTLLESLAVNTHFTNYYRNYFLSLPHTRFRESG